MPETLEQTGAGQREVSGAGTRTMDEPAPEADGESRRGKPAAADGAAAARDGTGSVPEDGATIVSIIKGLEGQVETAFKLKEVVEADLEAAQQRLSEELAARAELKARVEALEPRAALVDQLRRDIAFAEQERDKLASALAETRQQLEAVTGQRDTLTGQLAAAGAQAAALEEEKTTLQAQVMNLSDKLEELNRLRHELAEATEARRDLGERVRNLSNRLEASDALKGALEGDLAEAREAARGLRQQVEELGQRLASAEGRVADLRLQLEEQQAANRNLMEINTRLESEIRTMKVDHAAARSELDVVKRTLRDVSSELSSTSKRVRQRYMKDRSPSRPT